MIDNITINIIVAASNTGVIGVNGSLPWKQSDDLKRFKKLTMNGSVIMGRKTYESLPSNLKGRKQIVLTRDEDYALDKDSIKAFSVGEALFYAVDGKDEKEVWVIGGAEIYKNFLPIADNVYLTRIDSSINGDAYFHLTEDWQMIEEEVHKADNSNQYDYSFQLYTRIEQSKHVYIS